MRLITSLGSALAAAVLVSGCVSGGASSPIGSIGYGLGSSQANTYLSQAGIGKIPEIKVPESQKELLAKAYPSIDLGVVMENTTSWQDKIEPGTALAKNWLFVTMPIPAGAQPKVLQSGVAKKVGGSIQNIMRTQFNLSEEDFDTMDGSALLIEAAGVKLKDDRCVVDGKGYCHLGVAFSKWQKKAGDMRIEGYEVKPDGTLAITAGLIDTVNNGQVNTLRYFDSLVFWANLSKELGSAYTLYLAPGKYTLSDRHGKYTLPGNAPLIINKGLIHTFIK